ncbi:hypothetical protein BHM03_00045180 [Ensete ventricosum]|nr:hypothetical protein BHM03_00045180 [Ensete ventricosum]
MLELMFYSSLASGEEMKAFATYSFTSKNGKIVCTGKLAGMLEGGERTPILNPVELEEIGSMLWSLPVTRQTGTYRPYQAVQIEIANIDPNPRPIYC